MRRAHAATATAAVTIITAVLAPTAPAEAGSHNWIINEVFSNADGSVQFIEMKECCGTANETGLGGKAVSSATTGNQYVFPANLECSNCTANKHLLLATASFAALPGAPTPDYIIQPSFFDLETDQVKWHIYAGATLSFGPGELPTNGVDSLGADGATAQNSPTNFADETGSVTVPCHPADLDLSGDVGFNDLLQLLAAWGPCAECPADFDASGEVDFADLLLLLAGWGPC